MNDIEYPRSQYHVECYNYNTKKKVISSVFDFFVLATVHLPPSKDNYKFTGLNVGIVVRDRGSADKAMTSFFTQEDAKGKGTFTVYIHGPNHVKIPVEIHGGNGNGNFGYGCPTACFFGYINPLMFDTFGGGKHWVEDVKDRKATKKELRDELFEGEDLPTEEEMEEIRKEIKG